MALQGAAVQAGQGRVIFACIPTTRPAPCALVQIGLPGLHRRACLESLSCALLLHRRSPLCTCAPAPPHYRAQGTLAQLDSRNPVMYIDFPEGRLKLFGTLTFPRNKRVGAAAGRLPGVGSAGGRRACWLAGWLALSAWWCWV